jgi:hypothetical protein
VPLVCEEEEESAWSSGADLPDENNDSFVFVFSLLFLSA